MNKTEKQTSAKAISETSSNGSELQRQIARFRDNPIPTTNAMLNGIEPSAKITELNEQIAKFQTNPIPAQETVNDVSMMTLNVRPVLCDTSHLTHEKRCLQKVEPKVQVKPPIIKDNCVFLNNDLAINDPIVTS